MRLSSMLAVAVMVALIAVPARADDRATVEAFYTKILTAGGAADPAGEADRILAPNWASVGDYSGKAKDRAAFVKQVAGFHQLMPDLKWKIEEIIVAGDRVIVRGRASGTPKGPFFGVAPSGKPFEIMSIDIHTVKDGKIVTSYHVEDWASALAQLRAK